MRIFLDVYFLEWEAAWKICKETFSYTNHTVLPEALEKWGIDLMKEVLPRQSEIVIEINRRFNIELQEFAEK